MTVTGRPNDMPHREPARRPRPQPVRREYVCTRCLTGQCARCRDRDCTCCYGNED